MEKKSAEKPLFVLLTDLGRGPKGSQRIEAHGPFNLENL